MLSKLFKHPSRLSRSRFSSTDQEELELLIDSHDPPGGGGFARFTGLTTGLIATKNAPTAEVLTLLGITDVPERLQELVSRYVAHQKQRLDADLFIVPGELYESEGRLEWLTGLGQAVTLDVSKAQQLLKLPHPHVRQMMRRLLAFSPVPISGMGLPDTAELNKIRRTETRLLKSPDLGDVLLTLSETVNFLLGAYSDTESSARVEGDSASGTVRRSEPKTGPNQPCPCGSGKKYKKCHGAPGSV